MIPGVGHRLLLVPFPLPVLAGRGPLPGPLDRPRLPLKAGSPSLSQLGVDGTAAGVPVEALGIIRGVPICPAGVSSLFRAA